MKEYKAVINLFHESFGGYTHRDGRITYIILAKNEQSARKKLKRLAKEYDTGRRWYTIYSFGKKSEDE